MAQASSSQGTTTSSSRNTIRTGGASSSAASPKTPVRNAAAASPGPAFPRSPRTPVRRPASSSARTNNSAASRRATPEVPKSSQSRRATPEVPKSRTVGNAGTMKSTKRKELEVKQAVDQAHIMKLPADLLGKLFTKLDSIYDIVTCSLVCQGWREIFQLQTVWKEYFLKWHEQQQLPKHAQNWHDAFIKNISKMRERLFSKTLAELAETGLVQAPFDRPLVRNFSFTSGIPLQLLADRLLLRFYLRINKGPEFRVSGRGVVRFPASCILHCPVKLVKKGSKLASLTSIEIGAYSDKLCQSYRIAQLDLKNAIDVWECLSGRHSIPLRILQRQNSRGTTVLVGTLAEFSEDSAFGNEEILFIKIALHFHLVLTELLKPRREVPRVPRYGTGVYRVTAQFHTLNRLLWTEDFDEVSYACEPGANSGILQLLSSCQIVPHKCSLPWRSEAFSGEVERTLIATLTLQGSQGNVLWSCIQLFHLEPVDQPIVEYAVTEFEGMQFHSSVNDTSSGVFAAIKCSIPERELMFALVFRNGMDRMGSLHLCRQWWNRHHHLWPVGGSCVPRSRVVALATSADHPGTGGMEWDFARHIMSSGHSRPLDNRRPTPLMPPSTVVRVLMEALMRNDWPEDNSGIRTAFDFSMPFRAEEVFSVKKDASTRIVKAWDASEIYLTFDEFLELFTDSGYAPLLKCSLWKVASPVVFYGTGDRQAAQAVKVKFTSSQGEATTRAFTFCLRKVFYGAYRDCWLVTETRIGDHASTLQNGTS